jgi:hypothetical protein
MGITLASWRPAPSSSLMMPVVVQGVAHRLAHQRIGERTGDSRADVHGQEEVVQRQAPGDPQLGVTLERGHLISGQVEGHVGCTLLQRKPLRLWIRDAVEDHLLEVGRGPQ